MYSIPKQLPSKTSVAKNTTKPIAIPTKRDYIYDNNQNSTFISNTPPNDFMNHLQKRMNQFSTSPSFVYNLRN